MSSSKARILSVTELFNSSVREYSVYANLRAIPSVMDGLKPSQRKAIFGTLKRSGSIPNTGIKVSQLAAAVSECLAADTLINVFGHTIRVDLLHELLGENCNFEIDCIDPLTGQLTTAICNGILERDEVNELIEIELSSGEIIKITPWHKLLTINGWKKAIELTEKDELINIPVINKITNITEMIDDVTAATFNN